MHSMNVVSDNNSVSNLDSNNRTKIMTLELIANASICLTILYYAIMMVAYFRLDKGIQLLRLALIGSLFVCSLVLAASMLSNSHESPLRSCIACALTILSNFLFWSARRAHGTVKPSAAFSAILPSQINRNGPYAIIRHPFYAAYILVFAAGAISIGTLSAFVIPVVAIAIYYGASTYEESQLCQSDLGIEYRNYARNTGRFLPKIRFTSR